MEGTVIWARRAEGLVDRAGSAVKVAASGRGGMARGSAGTDLAGALVAPPLDLPSPLAIGCLATGFALDAGAAFLAAGSRFHGRLLGGRRFRRTLGRRFHCCLGWRFCCNLHWGFAGRRFRSRFGSGLPGRRFRALGGFRSRLGFGGGLSRLGAKLRLWLHFVAPHGSRAGVGSPGARRSFLFWGPMTFMNASYTAIVPLRALGIGVFTAGRGTRPFERKGRQLQNRDSHRTPARGW